MTENRSGSAADLRSLDVEWVPIDQLQPYAANSRTHSDEQIKQVAHSIREWGWTNPILTNDADMIIAGHARHAAARMLGMVSVPRICLSGLTEDQVRAYVIADNKLAENAGWDETVLGAELQALSAAGFDLSLIGFGDDDLRALLMPGGEEGLTDPDEVPPEPVHATSRLGDVWLLGAHRLVCGDCEVPMYVDLALNGVRPHLMVTDPPYGVEYDPEWREESGLADKGKLATGKVLNDDRADWRKAWALFPGAVAYVWHAGTKAHIVAQSLVATGFSIRAQIVWVKNRFAVSRGHYHHQHEPLFEATRDGGQQGDGSDEVSHALGHYAVRDGSTAGWAGGRKQSTVWFIDGVKNDTGHGTQKPVECMERPIRNNSSPGQAVYEPFCGSGTTLIACERTRRACHAIELDPIYIDVIVTRWQNYTGGVARLASTGQPFEQVVADRASEAGKPGSPETGVSPPPEAPKSPDAQAVSGSPETAPSKRGKGASR